MNKEDYRNKLTDQRWIRKREKIVKRDNYTCKNCGKTNVTLNVHHLFYKEGVEPWDYKDDELITLCKECHESGHLKEKKDVSESVKAREYIRQEISNDADSQFTAMPEFLKEQLIKLTESKSVSGIHRRRKFAIHAR